MKNIKIIESMSLFKIFTVFFFLLVTNSNAQENWRNDYNIPKENIEENDKLLDNLSRTELDYQEAIKQLKIEKLTLSSLDDQDRIEQIDDEIKIIEDQLDELRKLNSSS